MNPSLFNKVLGSLIGFAIGDSLASGATSSPITESMVLVADAYITYYNSYIHSPEHPIDYETQICHGFEFCFNSSSSNFDPITRKVVASSYGKPKEDWMENSKEILKDLSLSPFWDRALARCLFPALLGNDAAAISQGALTHNNNESSRNIYLYVQLLQQYLGRTSHCVQRKTHFVHPCDGSPLHTFLNSAYWAAEKDFKSAISGAIENGPVTAALTGALIGARVGFSLIPQNYVKSLSEETYNKLRTLAEKATEIITDSQEENTL